MGFFSWLFGGSSAQGVSRKDQQAIRRGPADASSLVQEAVKSGELDRARTLVHMAVGQHPDCEALAELGDSIENTITWNSINELLPQLETDYSTDLRARLADLHWRVGDKETALLYGREAVQYDPDSLSGYRVLGKIHLEQFRATCGSIEGQNALRCLLKAHKLAPTDSNILLKLTDLFVILKAPIAASKFLLPVKRAFENDAQVLHLAAKIEELPPENTTQIQDLFLALEDRELGQEQSGETNESTQLPASQIEELEALFATVSDESEFFIVDDNRNVVWSYSPSNKVSDEAKQQLGILSDTSRRMSRRMSIGDFQDLFVESTSSNAFLGMLKGDLCAIQVGVKLKKSSAEKILEKVEKIVASQTTGAVA